MAGASPPHIAHGGTRRLNRSPSRARLTFSASACRASSGRCSDDQLIAYDKLHQPFHVTSFVAAVEGALIVGVVTWVAHLVLRDED